MDKKTGFILGGAAVLGGLLWLTAGGGPPPGKFRLTVGASPATGGTVTGGGDYDEGTLDVPVTATPNAGYNFTRWQVDGVLSTDTNATMFIDMDANHTIIAEFTPIEIPALTFGTLAGVVYSEFGWWPRVFGQISNNSGQYITNRVIRLYRRYTVPASGNVILQSTTQPLTVYGQPRSSPLLPVTLIPGGTVDINFIADLDLPQDPGIDSEVWIQDALTGDKSNIMIMG
jgi:hypothetical protein